VDSGDLDVDFGMPLCGFQDFIGPSQLKMDGLAVPFQHGVFARFQFGYKTEHILIKRDCIIHASHYQHRADSIDCMPGIHFVHRTVPFLFVDKISLQSAPVNRMAGT
jgi:hypothetical protein